MVLYTDSQALQLVELVERTENSVRRNDERQQSNFRSNENEMRLLNRSKAAKYVEALATDMLKQTTVRQNQKPETSTKPVFSETQHHYYCGEENFFHLSTELKKTVNQNFATKTEWLRNLLLQIDCD